MKKLTILLLFFCCKTFAQNNAPQPVIYDFFYTTIFNQLFEQGQKFKTFESELISSQDKSFFFTIPTAETYAGEEDDERNVFFREDTLFKVTKFNESNTLLFTDKLFSKKEKYYTDTLYPMKWEMRNDKKMIDSLTCYKATAFFKGRNYTAWYCPAIAIPNGPWKLGGLPGLIIEVYDERKDLRFMLKRMRMLTYSNALDHAPTLTDFGLLPSYPDYIKSGHAFLKRFKEQLSSMDEGNCLECHSSTKLELHNWENVIH